MTAWRFVLRSTLWLVVPILVLNAVFAGALPAAYQPDVFWHDIPAGIAWAEHGLRVVLFASMAALPLRVAGPGVRAGWMVFVTGLLAYATSWVVLVCAPTGPWASSIFGFTAPAWTPAVWLAGIGLIGGGPPIAGRLGLRRLGDRGWATVYASLVTGFVATHVAHAALVWSRLP